MMWNVCHTGPCAFMENYLIPSNQSDLRVQQCCRGTQVNSSEPQGVYPCHAMPLKWQVIKLNLEFTGRLVQFI